MTELAPRLVQFASRHRWSLPLSGLSAICFLRLSSELSEGELGEFDRAVSHAVAQTRGSLDVPMYSLTRFGDGASLAALVVLTLVALAVLRRWREVGFVALAGVGTWTWIWLLKLSFHRARPGATELYLLSAPASFSFPSGHAFGSTGVLLGLVIVARVLGLRGARFVAVSLGAALVVLGVATSRVYFGVHFPTDVIGGIFAGAAWVAAITGFFYPAALPGEHRRQPGE